MQDLWMLGLLTIDRVPEWWGRIKIFSGKNGHQGLKVHNLETKRGIEMGSTDKMIIRDLIYFHFVRRRPKSRHTCRKHI